MNQWYFYFEILLALFMLKIGIIICIILFIVRKRKKLKINSVIAALCTNCCLLVVIILFSTSHSTYYKYNDWVILQSNINTIEQKYGEFDLGEIRENEKGRVGYYIYTDNGPIMPDHLKHYYYIAYDEEGIVYDVYDSCQPGG